MSTNSQKLFLVLYDYGTGGLWALVSAESAEEILKICPKLEIIENKPRWMTDDQYENIELKSKFDIKRPTGWLLSLIYGIP